MSRRNLGRCSWNELLRAGIRGGAIEEIVAELSAAAGTAEVMEPCRRSTNDRIDLWFQLTSESIGPSHSRFALAAKRGYRGLMKRVKAFTGIEFLSELALTFRKRRTVENRSWRGI